MDSLKQILARHGVKVSSLEPWAEGFSLIVPCEQSLDIWLKLRSLVPFTRHWPVLRETEDLDRGPLMELVPGPVDEVLARLRDERPERPPAGPILSEAEAIDPADWFRSRQREILADLKADLESETRAANGDEAATMVPCLTSLIAGEGFPRGPWPEARRRHELGTILTSSRRRQETAVVLVPAAESWHVPAYLDLGGWNACPFPQEHVAIWSYWHRRYDAEVMTVTHDVVEMRVGRPPMTREDAIALAREQYLYCEDIVSQGVDTIDGLAAHLLENPVWFFWWD